MGFVTKTWKDPVNIDSNNLNRIEQGIKNSHDTLEILEEEVSNLQTKQLDILEQLKTSTPNISSDTILEQLNSILGDTEILTALKNADNFLTKSAQELTKAELNQVYKNLDLDRMLKLTDIRVNDTSVVQGSIASITLPKVDKILNLNSNNAISNSAVVRAINKLIKDIENNTTFYLKDAIEDDEHMTVSKDEIVKWNSINLDSFITNESDPTVPAWAKASTKPIYTYNEILGTPTIPTNNLELENGRGYITSSEASTIANNLLNTFQTNTINPLSSRVTNLEAMDITLTTAINNKADANHTHSNLASITWVTEEIEDKIAELVGSAPATLDTIQELAAALNNNADIIDTINSTIANKATIKFGNTIQTTVTFDSDPQTQLNEKLDKSGGEVSGDVTINNGHGIVLEPSSAGQTYNAFKFYAQGDDVFVEKQKVEGGADYQKLLPLDSSLSITSENAVQNRVVTEALNNKTTVNISSVTQNTINFTSDPQTQIDNITGDISTLQDDVEELGNELNTTNSNLSTEITNRENSDTNLQNQIDDINDNSWTLFLHQPLSTVSGVSSVNITDVFNFHDYDYKIEYLWTSDQWSAGGVKLRFSNSMNNIITFPHNSWTRTTLNADYNSGQEGFLTPSGYAKCGYNDTIVDWGLDANDSKGPIVYNGEFIAGYDCDGNRVINYNTLSSRASYWCQQQYQYSGTLDISDSLIADGITGLNLYNDENKNLLANKSYIKLYRRKGGWNNNF